METVISIAQNLTQNSPLKIIGNDDPLFVRNFQHHITLFLITILVALTSAPFFMILIGLIMFTAEQNDKKSEMGSGEVKKSSMKSVPLTSFIRIFIEKWADVPRITQEIVKRFGLAFKLNIIGFIRIVMINDPVMLKKLDLFTEPIHLHKPSWYHKIMPILSKNGSTTTPAQREKLLQAFNNKNLTNHVKTFESHAKKILSNFNEELKDTSGHRIKSNRKINGKISKCAFDIFADISLGCEIDINPKENDQLFQYFERVNSLAAFCFNHHFILSNLLWALHPVKWYMDRTFRQIFKIVSKIIENTDQPQSTKETKSGSISEMTGKSLIEVMSKAGLSNEEISQEIVAFMAWGHRTITMTLNKLMFHLADNKEYQKICQQEIDTMFKKNEKDLRINDEVSNEAFSELNYLNRSIHECLRLYPTFPLFGRNVNTTVQLDKNITIPAGTNVLTSHWLLHRNPDNFSNPEIFNPDRFLVDDSKNRDIYEYMSCSLGPTNCVWHSLITQQLKVLASYILRDFDLYTDTKTDHLQTCNQLDSYMPNSDVKLRTRLLN